MGKQRKINVKLIERQDDNGEVRQCYQIMDALVAKHHTELAEAKIALAWHMGWKIDKDGHWRLGQAKKASDLDRELHQYDFVILLNFSAWNKANFTVQQMEALLDHELCHCTTTVDEDGHEKLDTSGRPVYRTRKHDVEEFRDVVSRHGLWIDDLRQFVEAAQAKDRDGMFAKTEAA